MIICAGHYFQRPGYHIVRKKGTRSWLLALTINGAGSFTHSQGVFTAGPQTAVLLKSGSAHDYATSKDQETWEFLWAHFHPWAHWLTYLDWPKVADGVMALPLDADQFQTLKRYMLEAVAVLNQESPMSIPLGMNAIERGLLEVAKSRMEQMNSGAEHRVSPALALMERSLAEELPVSRLAAVCGLSESRFAHVFKEEIGMTPRAFLEAQRVARAKQLLRLTPWPLERIAVECGFPNAFYLSTRFTKVAGRSPSMFRNAEDTEETREPVI